MNRTLPPLPPKHSGNFA